MPLSRLGTCFIAFSVPSVLVALAGCSSNSANFHETRTQNMPAVTSAPITVETANGFIDVSADPSLTGITYVVELKATTEERLKAVEVITEASADGRLVFKVKWPGEGRKSPEGASFTIKAPSVNSPTLQTSNGAITLSKGVGDATLKSSNGKITVTGVEGTLKVDTSNGAISATGVTGAVQAETSNGRIEIKECASKSGGVKADTSNGRVEVSLPPTFAGPLVIDTSNGTVEVTLFESFPGTLDISTSNGEIKVDPFANMQTQTEGNRHRVLSFPTKGPASTIKSSNGNVKVQKGK